MYTLNIVHTIDIKITQALSVTAAATPAPNESSSQLSQAAGQTCGDVSAAIALLRAYSPVAGDHFYTTDAVEMANAAANLGYSSEGTACHVLACAIGETIPLYRMYSPSSRDHFYTTSKEEADNAAKNYGYTNEGTAAYVYPSQSCSSVPSTACTVAELPITSIQRRRASETTPSLTWDMWTKALLAT